MPTTPLPFRATTEQACAWLAQETGQAWTLARLLEHALTPYVWLDYDPALAELFGEANGGYAAPIFYQEDIARLAAGSAEVLITRTKDAYSIVATLPASGLTRGLDQLRFLKKDIERLPGKLQRQAEPAAPAQAAARESQLGIGREQVLAAFAGMLKIDLAKALDEAGGIFGDDGARVKASAKKSNKKAVWNPVTLALGLNDVYRVPFGHLRRAFKTHEFLWDWSAEWEESLALLGK